MAATRSRINRVAAIFARVPILRNAAYPFREICLMLFPVLKTKLLQIRKSGLILFSNLFALVTFRFRFLIYPFKNTILMQFANQTF